MPPRDEFSLGNVTTTRFRSEISPQQKPGGKCPPAKVGSVTGTGSPAGAAGGPGKGRERTNPPGRPLIPSVSMGAHHRSNYWGKLQPFTTCRSRRGAVLNGKLHGVSLVLLLLLFNSQGRRIYGLSLLIIRPSQIKMIDSSACFTAALGGYYSC